MRRAWRISCIRLVRLTSWLFEVKSTTVGHSLRGNASSKFSLPETYFHFTCFNVQDPHDPSVGLINGELAIPGILIRREVFDPVVNQVGDRVAW